MTSALEQQPFTDGTNQADRLTPALDPSYVAVDERSPRDLLVFAYKYAQNLRFFDVTNGALGSDATWEAFFGSEPNFDEIIAFMEDPDSVSPAAAAKYRRPHFTLFLTFLKLLQHAQTQMNGLTKRHLDFYYQTVLKMAKRPGIPDQVNVLVDLAKRETAALLPAGTLLDAGQDSAGQPLVYQTDENIIVSQAQVQKLHSLFIKQQIEGIPEAHQSYADSPIDGFCAMLRMALGNPQPADDLPSPYFTEGVDRNSDLLRLLQDSRALVTHVRTILHMSLADFRKLVRTKRKRDDARSGWGQVNELLQQAYRKRTKNEEATLPINNVVDFEINFKAATDSGIVLQGDGVSEVNNVYDLYNHITSTPDDDNANSYILNTLHFESIEDFKQVIDFVKTGNADWQLINNLLLIVGVKTGRLKPVEGEPADLSLLYDDGEAHRARRFEENLHKVLGEDLWVALETRETPIASVDALYKALDALEKYFYISAEEYADMLMSAVDDEGQINPLEEADWGVIYNLLAKAHRHKVYAQRLNDLETIWPSSAHQKSPPIPSSDRLEAFKQMLAFGGESFELDQLRNNLSTDDFETLEDIEKHLNGEPLKEELPDGWEKLVPPLLERGLRPYLLEPVAEQILWRNLYPAVDATAIQLRHGVDGEQTRWATFGRAPLTVSPAPPQAEIGWAVSSPLLDLSAGGRTITITLGFNDDDNINWEAIQQLIAAGSDENSQLFKTHLSSEEGWVTVKSTIAYQDDYFAIEGVEQSDQEIFLKALKLTVTLDVSHAPLTPLPIEETSIQSPWPLLKIILRHTRNADEGEYITQYQPLKDLQLARVYIQSEVNGLTPTHLQNDNGLLNPSKPFQPFGREAVTGSRFYIGHPELIVKPITNLAFAFEWKGVPTGFTSYQYYKNYFDHDPSEESEEPKKEPWNSYDLSVAIALFEQRKPASLGNNLQLFEFVSQPEEPIEQTQGIINLDAKSLGEKAQIIHTVFSGSTVPSDILSWPRYLRWDLEAPGFMHDVYPLAAMKKATQLAAQIAKESGKDQPDIDPAKYQVNPPYTPEMKWLTINYTSSAELDLSQYDVDDHHSIFHVHPFGYSEIHVTDGQAPFLPEFDYAGELYIGIRDIEPPQDLALLFQLAEGTADPDLPRQDLAWHYLSGNQWLTLEEGNLLEDRTRGLINSGIVRLALKPAAPNTLLDPNLYWLRVAIPRYTDSVCDIVAIHAQAVTATFVDQNNAADHLSQPLPPETITDLGATRPQIAGIRQPYTSFGGKIAEQDTLFYTRISERLRHKGRAQAAWDYEHLVLDQFPEIYKVKCLPASHDQLGVVRVVVIPDIQNKLPADPFAPKASADLLANIETFLQDKIPTFATIRVQNPRYVPVRIRVGIRFRDGYNPGFYKQQLNEDINRFLSPWAYGESADVSLGGRIYANSLVNFIDEREYIDYVAQIKLFTHENKTGINEEGEGYWVETAAPDEVLVAARQHDIDLIREDVFMEENFTGINYMKIELDFEVG